MGLSASEASHRWDRWSEECAGLAKRRTEVDNDRGALPEAATQANWFASVPDDPYGPTGAYPDRRQDLGDHEQDDEEGTDQLMIRAAT